MPQINFNKLYDVVVNWFRPKNEVKLQRNNLPVIVDEVCDNFDEEMYLAMLNRSYNIVKGVTQVDESLLAEYQNVPGWHRK